MYDIPDSVGFVADDFARAMEPGIDGGQYRNIPTVADQACSSERFEKLPQPIAGRSWTWDASNRQEQVAVSLNVTGWTAGTGARQVTNVARDTGACRFLDPVREVARGDDHWSGWATRTTDGRPLAYALRLLEGDVIVAVSVADPEGMKAALATAESLLDTAVQRAVDAGLGTVR
jgi:hypothetical protein